MIVSSFDADKIIDKMMNSKLAKKQILWKNKETN